MEFARVHGCIVIAQGIESAMRWSGAGPLGQGFYLGRPVPVERAFADAAGR